MTLKSSLISALKKTGHVASVTGTAVVHYAVDIPVDATVTAAHATKEFFGEKGASSREAKINQIKARREQQKAIRAQEKLLAAEKAAKEAAMTAKEAVA